MQDIPFGQAKHGDAKQRDAAKETASFDFKNNWFYLCARVMNDTSYICNNTSAYLLSDFQSKLDF